MWSQGGGQRERERDWVVGRERRKEKGFSIYCAGQLGDEAFAETDLWDYRLRRSAMGVKNKPFE